MGAISQTKLFEVRCGETIRFRWGLLLTGLLGFCLPLMAAVLPEDRADFMYHYYDGGGITIDGPSILARTSIDEEISVWGNYYVDSITSASIDVVTAATSYKEKRTEKSLGLDLIQDSTTLSLGYTNSIENDFLANSLHFTVSQDMFGDLTNLSLGYSRGWDEVTKTGDPTFEEEVKRQHFRLGVSQILTKNLLMDLSFETITDEGYLNNPYRTYRYVNGGSYAFSGEVYPNTRTSHSVALRALYYLPYRAAIKGEYRLFTDTWGVQANMWEVGYTHPVVNEYTLDFTYRYYTQTRSDFYSDLFPSLGSQNYMARDKELSTFTSQAIGVAFSYDFIKSRWSVFDKGTTNISYNRIMFDYKDFRDLRTTGYSTGNEPLYKFSADVIQFYVSVWY